MHIPFVTHVQDIFPEPVLRVPLIGCCLYKALLPFDKYVLRTACKVIVIGPRLGNYLARTRNISRDRFDVVYNWQDESRFTNVIHKEKESSLFTFMFCGSFSVSANLEFIADSFIKANNSNARFVFAGNGNTLVSLMNKAANNKSVHIEFIQAPSSEVGQIQSQADVLVMPLKKEMSLLCFPSKFPAYLFSHKPILACVESNSDVADCVLRASCGWVVEPENENALVELFKNIPKQNLQILEEMGRNAYEFSQHNLTKETNLNRIVGIIEMIKN